MAASAGAIRAGSAYVEIFARDGQFQQSMSRIRARMMTLGTQLRQAGTSMTLGGAAAGAPFILAARTAAAFSLEMARVKAVAEANDVQFASLNARAKELAVEFGKSPTEVAAGMGELAKAGLKAEGVMKSITPILAVAAGDNLDLARAVEVVVSTMQQFGMGTDDFGSIADKLRTTSDSSTSSVDSLGEALTYIGPKALDAGQDIDTILASLAVLSDAGLRGSLGGTGLSRIIESIANEEDKLAALGVSTRDQNKNMLPFMDIMEELGKKAPTANIDAIRVMTEIFEIRGANAAISLSNMREKYDEVMLAIGRSGGTAVAKAKAVMESFGGAVAQLGAQFSVLQSQVIESMGPIATQVVQGFTQLLSKLGEFISQNGTLVMAVAAGTAATFGLGVAAISLGVSLQGLASALRLVQGGLSLIPALFNPVGLAVAGLVAGVGGVVVAAQALSPAFREETNAIGAALMRLDFGAAWELMNIQLAIGVVKMQQLFQRGFSFVGNSVTAVASYIADTLNSAMDRFLEVFGVDILTLQEGFQKLGYYIRWAFDWSFNTTELTNAIRAVEDEVDRVRAKFPTAEARANGMRDDRQQAADERAEQGRQRDAAFEARLKALRDDADRVKRRGEEAAKPQPVTKSPGDMAKPEKVAAAPPGAFMPPEEKKEKKEKEPREPKDATEDRGLTSAGNWSGVGLDIGPELGRLEDPAQRTADATERTAETIAMLADQGKAVSDRVGGDRTKLTGQADQLMGELAGLSWDAMGGSKLAAAEKEKKMKELAKVQSDLAAFDAFASRQQQPQPEQPAIIPAPTEPGEFQRQLDAIAMMAADPNATAGDLLALGGGAAMAGQANLPPAPPAIALDAVAPRAPALQRAAMDGQIVAQEQSQIGVAFRAVGNEIVAAIVAGTAVSQQMLSVLNRIADKKPVEVAFQ